ncbi:hypothetical protein IWZ01DRAFT_130379 [Phyllosticta capitalensis]
MRESDGETALTLFPDRLACFLSDGGVKMWSSRSRTTPGGDSSSAPCHLAFSQLTPHLVQTGQTRSSFLRRGATSPSTLFEHRRLDTVSLGFNNSCPRLSRTQKSHSVRPFVGRLMAKTARSSSRAEPQRKRRLCCRATGQKRFRSSAEKLSKRRRM